MMEKQKNNTNKEQVLTEKMNLDSNSFNEFQAILLNKANERSNDRKRKIELIALKFQMEDYLHSTNKEYKLVGDFLKAYLNTFKIRQNKFAEYIGIKSSNLNKLIKGERSLNHELALIFGTIFGNDPMLWLDIQDKNKLLEISKTKKIKNYSLDDLIKKAS